MRGLLKHILLSIIFVFVAITGSIANSTTQVNFPSNYITKANNNIFVFKQRLPDHFNLDLFEFISKLTEEQEKEEEQEENERKRVKETLSYDAPFVDISYNNTLKYFFKACWEFISPKVTLVPVVDHKPYLALPWYIIIQIFRI